MTVARGREDVRAAWGWGGGAWVPARGGPRGRGRRGVSQDTKARPWPEAWLPPAGRRPVGVRTALWEAALVVAKVAGTRGGRGVEGGAGGGGMLLWLGRSWGPQPVVGVGTQGRREQGRCGWQGEDS